MMPSLMSSAPAAPAQSAAAAVARRSFFIVHSHVGLLSCRGT
jgi:hypothetical protein